MSGGGLTGTITNFSGYFASDPNGNWVLDVYDDLAADVGVVNDVFLTIEKNIPLDWELIEEVSIIYKDGTAIIVNSKYSADPELATGINTALTRSTVSAGSPGTTLNTLVNVLDYSSDSPNSTVGNYWVNTTNMSYDTNLVDGTTYFYQLWRKGKIDTPTTLNENFVLIPMRISN